MIVQKGLLRNLVVIMDWSASSDTTDYRPSRRAVVKAAVDTLIREFFDQNPVSSLALIAAYNVTAVRVSALSGSPGVHTAALDNPETDSFHGGDFSLRNALHLALGALHAVPSHCTREVLLCASALFTTDADDIEDSIAALVRARVRVSIVGAGAAVHVYSRVAVATGGTYTVALNAEHYRAEIMRRVEPSAVLDTSLLPPLPNLGSGSGSVAAAAAAGAVAGRQWVQMGFPERTTASSERLLFCACHLKPVTAAHECPRCSTMVCELPFECPVCRLSLASAPHLARSYHHLYPLPVFVDVSHAVSRTNSLKAAAKAAATSAAKSAAAATAAAAAAATASGSNGSGVTAAAVSSSAAGGLRQRTVRGMGAAVCFGCQRLVTPGLGELVTACPACGGVFCAACDEFAHAALHNCPACLAKAERAPASDTEDAADDDDDDDDGDGNDESERKSNTDSRTSANVNVSAKASAAAGASTSAGAGAAMGDGDEEVKPEPKVKIEGAK